MPTWVPLRRVAASPVFTPAAASRLGTDNEAARGSALGALALVDCRGVALLVGGRLARRGGAAVALEGLALGLLPGDPDHRAAAGVEQQQLDVGGLDGQR